jgi:hypothetical protein
MSTARLLLWGMMLFIGIGSLGCRKPIDALMGMNRIAIVAIHYDATIRTFTPKMGVNRDVVYAEFSETPASTRMHEQVLNAFLIQWMRQTLVQSDVAIVRPLKLINTTNLRDSNGYIYYEYLLDPYDPIDISDTLFMAGLADRLGVDAVAKVAVSYAIYRDDNTVWDEYKDPHVHTMPGIRRQLRHGHQSSQLRTTIRLTVVSQGAVIMYDETRYIDTTSEYITVSDQDLSFDGGVSPKWLAAGMRAWLKDWQVYLPKQPQGD